MWKLEYRISENELPVTVVFAPRKDANFNQSPK